MHYYKRNIGDYHKKAGRLNLLQHGVYTILIDAIYDREKFPTKQEAIDWCWASTPEEVQAVEFILSKFFSNGNGTYKQKRIEEELNAFHSRSEINTRIAIERHAKRTNKGTKRTRNADDSLPNHKPLTNNQEPLPKEINPTAWEEFEQHRKEMRQPLTDLARTKAQNIIKHLPYEQQEQIINNTIQNRWKGLFLEKSNGTHKEPVKSHHAQVWESLKARASDE